MIYDELHIYPNAQEAAAARKAYRTEHGTRNDPKIVYATVGNIEGLIGIRTREVTIHDRDRMKLNDMQAQWLDIVYNTSVTS